MPRGGGEMVAASRKKQQRPRMASPGSDKGERRELRARGGDERGMAAPSESTRQPREWGIDGFDGYILFFLRLLRAAGWLATMASACLGRRSNGADFLGDVAARASEQCTVPVGKFIGFYMTRVDPARCRGA